MNLGARFCQIVQTGTGLFLLALSLRDGSWFVGTLALIGVVLGVHSLLSPTPEQRVQEKIEALRQQGIYPQGQANNEDVQRVLQAGHKLLAIRLYREVHNVPLKQAVAAVKQMV